MQTLVVHAHCYQPPREDPWLELVEAEPSAVPDHDWNVRIDRECYRKLGAAEVRAPDPRATARDPDARGGLARIVNLYAWCSFDVGATLCEWMDGAAPESLAAMRTGDAASVRRWGHGNAIAAPYHHVILPLASRRDKVTEVRWGIADFRRRFGREPEGMWLPECAVDEETLEVLALEGMRFTILAPYQIRTAGDHHGLPVRWDAGGGRSIRILPYDGALAGEVAFGSLLQDPHRLAHRFAVHAGSERASCTTLATDGETFGHHHRGGDAVLAEALGLVARRSDIRLANAATVVARHEPAMDAELVSPSSWSCAHGVERWRSDCGCRLDTSAHTSQRWRTPLRDTLEQVAVRCHEHFEREARTVFRDDPWAVRDAYGSVVAMDGEPLQRFAAAHVIAPTDEAQLRRGRELLELQRAALRTFTSCAWFFDDVARIETRQVLRYAARALELSGIAARLSPELVRGLERAHSNVPGGGTGADLFVREALPHRDSALRAGAGIIALLSVGDGDAASPGTCDTAIGAYSGTRVDDVAGGEGEVHVVVHHRRTGQQLTVAGRTEGSGPALVVHVRLPEAADTRPQEFTITDLPEHAARVVLAATVHSDLALASGES
jgi:hypothetical protein